MTHIRRVKSGSPVHTFIPAIISLTLFIFSAIFLSPIIGFKVLGTVILIYCVISFGFYYLKTRSYMYLISSTYLLAFGLVLITMQFQYSGNPNLVFPPITRFFLFWMVLFWIWLFYLMVTNQIRWKGSNVMELAAIGVERLEDAYTERPFPIGNFEYDKDEVAALTSFLRKHLISVDYQDNGKTYIVPLNNKGAMDLLLHPEFNVIETTWISFDTDGQVSVHISRKSYLMYKENLAFDQLCNNLGDLFIGFLEDYRKGENVRILDKLNSVKSDFFN